MNSFSGWGGVSRAVRAGLLIAMAAAPLLCMADDDDEDEDDKRAKLLFQMPKRIACAKDAPCPTDGTDPLKRDGLAVRLANVKHEYIESKTDLSSRLSTKDALRLASRMFGGMTQGKSPMTNMEAFATVDMVLTKANGLAVEGRFDDARRAYEDILAAATGPQERDEQAEAAALANIGVVVAAQGRYVEAKEKLSLALSKYNALETTQTPRAGVRSKAVGFKKLVDAGYDPTLAELSAAQAELRRADVKVEARAAREGVLRALLNLANLDAQLGQYAEAEARLNLAAEQAGKDYMAFALVEQGVLNRKIDRPAVAADSMRRAAQAAPPAALIKSFGPVLALGAASAAAVLADSANAEGEQKRPSHHAEAGHARLQAEADQRERAGDLASAASVHGRAAMLASVVVSPERERVALAHLQRLHATLGNAELSIFFGKQAVNLAQRQRNEVGDMNRQARNAYLDTKKRSYASLVTLLIQRERLAEAEQVLRLLKEEEGQQFRRTLQASARGTIPYTAAESRYLARYEKIAEQTRELERQRQAVRGRDGVFGMSGAADSREDQENALRGSLNMISMSIAQFQTMPAEFFTEVARMRAIAAKPAASRSANEAAELRKSHSNYLGLKNWFADMDAGMRAFRRDAPFFLTPLTPKESAQADTAARGLQQVRATMDHHLSFLAGEPTPPPSDSIPSMSLMNGGAMRKYWAIDRQLEELDDTRAQLDTTMATEMASPGRSVDAGFAAADEALLATGRTLLGGLPPGTVAIYYLPGDTELQMLLVTREGRRAFWHPTPRPLLEERIQAFRQVLQNPRQDPRPAAQALHDTLIAPLAGALRDAKASTLMLALDGQLRYLPFAALHDGQGWLTERYAIDLYTTAAPAALAAKPAAKWRAAAFGSTAGGQGFGPLPAVRGELQGVVRGAGAQAQGALPGTVWLDRDFTAATLRAALKEKQNVVHIASHFAFRAGDPSESFLLLGDGNRLSLAEMASPDFRFDQVDLVTLSACETGLSGNDSFGQEVEGLGTLLQGQGAAAVLATLWSVADDSTAVFMRALYTQREQRGLSRAQSVREAQLAFIRGGGTEPAGAVQRGATRIAAADAAVPAAPAALPRDPARPYAHPFFWAPFVLMGNWL